MNKCCKQRRNSTCIGAEEGPTREMMCRVCKEAWHELVNPDAGPELLNACRMAYNKLVGLEADSKQAVFIAEELDEIEKAINKAEAK